MMSPIQVPSFAKINWFLEIVGKRPDGYHELLTLFQTVDFGDTLTFSPAEKDITLEVQGIDLPEDSGNLVVKAAESIRSATGCKEGARIKLHKRIPVGGGLGGGSSNAAITLLALNSLWDCGLRLGHLKVLASEIGSDVPFFLSGGACIGWGRGEKVYLVEAAEKERSLAILYPGFPISSAQAYSLLERPPVENCSNLTTDGLQLTIRRSREIIEAGDWSGIRNDFEEPVFTLFPLYRDFLNGFSSTESGVIFLSGSGSSLVASGDEGFLDLFTARATEFFQLNQGFGVHRCRSVSRGKYENIYGGLLRCAGLGQET
mgnify:CR=1 FL=1